MATANQLKTLIKSHFEDNTERFNTVALQMQPMKLNWVIRTWQMILKN